MTARKRSGLGLELLCMLMVACTPARARAAPPGGPRPAGTRAGPAPAAVEWADQGRLVGKWGDYGWSPRKLGPGPAQLDLSNWGGWIAARPGLDGNFGGLVFHYKAPRALGQFLEVRVDGDGETFPAVAVTRELERDLPDGFTEVFIPIATLDPDGLPFDRVVFRANKKVTDARITLDQIGLTGGVARAKQVVVRALELRIDCRAPTHPISPFIYGIAGDQEHDAQSWGLGPTARRWGGNTTSRYNWRADSWNTGSDWFFRNVSHAGEAPAYRQFLDDDLRHNVASALTVPLLGWVAKDGRSVSFPVAELGAQQQTDPYFKNAGNGVGPDGHKLVSGDPTHTSVAFTPDDLTAWVNAIRTSDGAHGRRSVDMYILDNEPMLWNSTHRDVHPNAVGYDELLDRTLRYGGAIRKADPEALIAGPALWGWPAYQFSAIDAEVGFRVKPDRRAHGDVALLPWYLRKLREHERETGEHILDIVDVHFYPQAQGVYGNDGGTDRATNARRIRSVRGLWDPSYVDESWIGEPVMLIPRLKKWIEESYPGRKISIGEYSFGAEQHMSGGLAQAEALGRFGEQGIYSAFYWMHPKEGTPAYWAFRAYRNFDGRGGHFLDTSLATHAAGDNVSLFASRDERGHLVAIALNLDPDRAGKAHVQLDGCGAFEGRTLSYAGGPKGFTPGEKVPAGDAVDVVLPPYSITVIDLERAP